MLTSFVYTPLKHGEFRLLHSTTSNDGHTTWSIETAQLLNRLPGQAPLMFDALSYTWGELGQTYPWVFSGAELQIHNNLKNPLPFLAQRRSSLPLWIDAVCINQQDDAEKLSQVALMHQIYRHASMVWVWLGELEDNSQGDATVSLVRQLGQLDPRLKEAQHAGQCFDPQDLGLPDLQSSPWQNVKRMVTSKWFNRLWIMQEAALAAQIKFLCGTAEVTWHDMEKLVTHIGPIQRRLRDSSDRSPTMTDGIQLGVFLVRQRHQTPEINTAWADHLLFVLITTASHCYCQDARDRVLGIMGFLNENRAAEIVKYANGPLENLYTHLSHTLLTNADQSHRRWWSLLGMANHPNRFGNLPSWVPCYHTFNDPEHGPRVSLLGNITTLLRETSVVKASRGRRLPKHDATDMRSLAMHGTILDTIEHALPCLPDIRSFHVGPNDEDPGKNIAGIWNFDAWLQGIGKVLFGPEFARTVAMVGDPVLVKDCLPRTTASARRPRLTLDDFWRTLCGNQVDRYDLQVNFKIFCDLVTILPRWADLLERTRSGQVSHVPSTYDEEAVTLACHNSPMNSLGIPIHFSLRGRRLFLTAGRRIGFGPANLQVGDTVCVFDFAWTPHVLRSVELGTAPPSYRLIGEAYVHGMMDGEIEALDLTSEDIILV